MRPHFAKSIKIMRFFTSEKPLTNRLESGMLIAKEMIDMFKAVFFDFDGVLTTDKYGSVSIAKFLSGKTGLPADLIRKAYQKHNGGLLTGRIDHGQMWDTFCEDLGVQMPIEWLTEAAQATPLDRKMLDLVRNLREQGIITGMITDNPASRVEEIVEIHGLRELFDVICVSGVVGSRKDQPTIFTRTLEAVNLPAVDCIFIDNTASNLVVPAQLGMKTHFFDDEKRDMEALHRALI